MSPINVYVMCLKKKRLGKGWREGSVKVVWGGGRRRELELQIILHVSATAVLLALRYLEEKSLDAHLPT